MAKKIYVGNLNYSTREESLQDMFAQYGEVLSVNIITDRYTGQSKGFGFVEMEEQDAAEAAISALDGSTLDNRELRVNEAKERERRARF
jgi:RNA recognition motif-containing protein